MHEKRAYIKELIDRFDKMFNELPSVKGLEPEEREYIFGQKDMLIKIKESLVNDYEKLK